MLNKIFALILLCAVLTAAQNKSAAIREYKKIFTTYEFSDPNPIPVMGNIYPYFRFDGYTDTPVQKEWKVVELENDYLKLMILPEIGGKIWSAVEKSTGKSFVYFNHIVKFRDIAMRGPWTSGGIEPNYGIIGHTPNCATPVDYLARTNDDGSVSCFIGTLDLLTRTNWRIEIKLEKDKAYLTTRSYWYNSTPLEQPYYTWMNTGLKAGGNLEFIYPGNKYLGHGGEYASWPINDNNGKNISWYEQNNFGGYKSYHVFGRYTDFFGAYWHDDNFGMARYSTRDDKPGKKIWIWGLSDQGMIWKNLLSDTDGQYVEVQSGRLFNQTAEQSTFTPFKHKGFAPYSFEIWTEYWYPVMGINGFVRANNYGALNLKYMNGRLKIYFSPVAYIDDDLAISSDGKVIYSRKVQLKPLQIFADSITTNSDPDNLIATLGKTKLVYESNSESDQLGRPVESPKIFDWSSAYGLYLQGKENIREKNYDSAQDRLNECLIKDPNFLPALSDLSMLMYRRMKYGEALTFAKRALSIDTYDAGSNYYYGLINKQIGKTIDAKDGFEIASHSVEYRCAAYLELSKIYFIENDFDRSLEYANKSLDFNRYNIDALQLITLIYQSRNDTGKAAAQLDTIFAFDPLNYFSLFERYLADPTEINKNQFLANFRNEMPQESFLELAVWYNSINLPDKCEKLLDLAPNLPEIIYWRAFIKNKLTGSYMGLIEKANSLSPNFSFPFRSESAPVLEWITELSNNWKPKYYLGLIQWDRRNYDQAKKLFTECGNEPDYAPFYASRYELFKRDNKKNAFNDLEKAFKIEPAQWRFTKLLTNHFIEEKQFEDALNSASSFYSKHPGNYIIGMLNARALLLNEKYRDCIRILKNINILPYEGATDGRQLWREAHLLLALDDIIKNNYNTAIENINGAKNWPLNLGVGKPYQEDIDERLEDWMEYYCQNKLNNGAGGESTLEKIISYKQNGFSINSLFTILAYKKIGDESKVSSAMKEWEEADPEKEIVKWCESYLTGHTLSLPESFGDNLSAKVLFVLQNK